MGIYRHWGQNCPEIIAVDNSQPMLDGFQSNLEHLLPARPPFTMHCADIRCFPIEDADMVIMHFTLQFIPNQTA